MSLKVLLILVVLAIPVLALLSRFLWMTRIPADRVLVGKTFPWWVMGYVLISFVTIYFSSSSDKMLCEHDAKAQTKPAYENYSWNHFMSPGFYTKEDDEEVVYNHLVDVLGAFIFNVLLITTLVNSLSRLREKWKDGRIFYNIALYYGWFSRNNVIVVLGNHDSVYEVVRQCLQRSGAKRPDYVLVLLEDNVDEYRSRMRSVISHDDFDRVVFCRGSLTSGLDLQNIHIEKATEVFILGNNVDDRRKYSTHDAECIKCVQLLRDNGRENADKEKTGVVTSGRRSRRYPPLMCRVFFEYQTSYSVFQTSDIGGKEMHPIKQNGTTLNKRVIVFKPMNYYEMSCERVAGIMSSDEDYIPLDGTDGIKYGSDQFVHVIIVGHTQMGTALGIETAHLAHFPNFFNKDDKGRRVGPRTRISFIDINADIEMEYFKGRFSALFELSPWRYRNLSSSYSECNEWIEPMNDEHSQFKDGHLGLDFMDVEWEFIKGNIASPYTRKYLASSVMEAGAKCTIAICFNDQNRSVATALGLPDDVCRKAQEILVFQGREGSVIDEMKKYDKSGHSEKFRSFGLISKSYSDAMCNEMEPYFDKDLIFVSDKDLKKPGKSQIACWWSNRYRYLSSEIKLRSFGTQYDLVDESLIGKVEHQRWNMEQLLMGIRPLTRAEQEQVMDNQISKDDLKREMAHLDICSTDRLREIDPTVVKYDLPMLDPLMKLCFAPNYSPKLIDTSLAEIPDGITRNSESLAANVHETWRRKRKDEKWVYGARRDDSRKRHPNMVPYDSLPESERDFDRNTAMGILKAAVASGYSFVSSCDVCHTTELLPEGIVGLSKVLAKNVHEVWSQGRISDGWKYGETRNDGRKEHPCLLPYGLLSDEERKYDEDVVDETLKMICSLGYSIVKCDEGKKSSAEGVDA